MIPKKYPLLLSLLAIQITLYAQIGCLKIGNGLKKYNNQEYQLAECYCPCTTIRKEKNICKKCNHTQTSHKWFFTSPAAQLNAQQTATLINLTIPPHQVMKKLITLYKRGKVS